MASLTNLEERFNKAVQTIQNLPPDGEICFALYSTKKKDLIELISFLL